MSALSVALVLVLGFLLFLLGHYLGHRFAHRPLMKTSYEAHAIGHHRLYTAEQPETPTYVHARHHYVIDYMLGIPSFVLLFLLLPTWVFLVIFAETLLLWQTVAWLHVAIHTSNHWVNRLSIGRTNKRLHLLHHEDMTVNFGFLIYPYDRLFGTFRSLSSTLDDTKSTNLSNVGRTISSQR